MKAEPLVVTTREVAGAFDPAAPLDEASIENVHHGSIAVVDVHGGLLSWAGDPHYPTFTRSSIKPLQALAFVRDGGPDRFGWSSREIALLCASHSGEAMHVETVASMLASIGCDERRLQCGCHVPGWYAAVGRRPPADREWSPLEHNCSGKHAGFLAACRQHDERVDDYLDPASGVQRRVVAALGDATGLAPDALPMGTDGCSAPNYALPLTALAGAFARLAQGPHAPRDGDAFRVLFDAMTGHPELVSGTSRSDLAWMSHAPGDWVTKIGADGVQAIGIRSRGIGIAIKIADGDRDALYCATLAVLEALGVVGRDDRARLPPALVPFEGAVLRNARGREVGRMRARFALRSA